MRKAAGPPPRCRRRPPHGGGFSAGLAEAHPVFASVKAAGHRVVHGMNHSKPERITPKLLAEG